jgi:uncharacterized protein
VLQKFGDASVFVRTTSVRGEANVVLRAEEANPPWRPGRGFRPSLARDDSSMSVWFTVAFFVAALVAGATASVVGFGIGSLLTPLVALRWGTHAAILVVALPHMAAGVLRAARLRQSIDQGVLVRFGLLSAAGGLGGALLFARLGATVLTPILGVLLVLTSSAGLTGWAERWHPHGPVVPILGLFSGFFGGVVGNQGGLRAAALSALSLPATSFVATSTAVGVLIDLVRVPVYLIEGGRTVAERWTLVIVLAAGALIGTLLGERLLLGLPARRFRVVVSVAVGLLGLWFVSRVWFT